MAYINAFDSEAEKYVTELETQLRKRSRPTLPGSAARAMPYDSGSMALKSLSNAEEVELRKAFQELAAGDIANAYKTVGQFTSSIQGTKPAAYNFFNSDIRPLFDDLERLVKDRQKASDGIARLNRGGVNAGGVSLPNNILAGIIGDYSLKEIDGNSLFSHGIEGVEARISSTNTKIKDIGASTSLATTQMQCFCNCAKNAFETSAVSAEDYRYTLEQVNDQEKGLGTQIWSGFGNAFENYSKNAMNAGQIVESVMMNALSNTEAQFIKFVQTGKFEFSSLIDSMLADLTRLLIQESIMKPIAGFIGGLFSPGQSISKGLMNSYNFNLGALLPFAQGNAFSSNTGLSSYRNSIVKRPTYFLFARGGIPSLGLMGEKFGSPGEAIMPLERNSRGDLAVNVTGSGSGASSRVVNNISVTPPAGYEAQRETTSNGQGGEDVKITFSRIAAAEASRFGSPLNRTLQTGGFKPQPVRRGG